MYYWREHHDDHYAAQRDRPSRHPRTRTAAQQRARPNDRCDPCWQQGPEGTDPLGEVRRRGASARVRQALDARSSSADGYCRRRGCPRCSSLVPWWEPSAQRRHAHDCDPRRPGSGRHASCACARRRSVGRVKSEERTCTRTGIRLIRHIGSRTVQRVARTSYGALNPVARERTTFLDLATSLPTSVPDPREWNRWDTPGRTAYFGTSSTAAYAEVLGQFKRLSNGGDPLEKDAASHEITVEQLIAEMEADDPSGLNFMQLGHLPASWRARRALYEVELPATASWWIDVLHGDTVTAIERTFAPSLPLMGYPHGLTDADLLGEDRVLTVAVASWLRGITLDDGTEPLGITHRSKRGWGESYAYWLRRVDEGLPLTPADPQVVQELPIALTDAELVSVCAAFNIKIH